MHLQAGRGATQHCCYGMSNSDSRYVDALADSLNAAICQCTLVRTKKLMWLLGICSTRRVMCATKSVMQIMMM